MSKKQDFIDMVSSLLEGQSLEEIESTETAIEFFEKFKEEESKPLLTDSGKIILKAMQQTASEYDNSFVAKNVAEEAGISTRGVAGGMRKLVSDGFVEITSTGPNVYALTAEGTDLDIDSV